MKFLRVNGVVIHYSDSGTDRPALVFANSLGTDFRIWDKVAPRFADRYRVICYDKRGHGLSETRPAPYSMTDHVDDLAALLDALDVRAAVVVGLSVGGVIAQGLAARRPDLVRGLILCGTAHRIGTEDGWNSRIATVTEKGIAAIADAVMKLWFTPAYRDEANAEFIGARTMLLNSPVPGYVGTCAALRDADLTESTRALAVPVLCLVGDSDGSTPPDLVRSMATLIQGAEFHIIPQAGHIPCLEQPDVMASLMQQFMAAARL